MGTKRKTAPGRTLVSPALADAYMDFILSREAMSCTVATIDFYRFTAHQFLLWAEENHSANAPSDITGRLVRQYIAGLKDKGKSDRTLHANARAVRTLIRFWHKEKYIPELFEIQMPKVAKKRLPVLNESQLKIILDACNIRDKAIVMFMADSGIRCKETIMLNWGDINMSNGLVKIHQGKGKKDRFTVIGAKTRRALLAYKRTVDCAPHLPLFQSRVGNHRFTGTGMLLIYRRLSKATGIHATPHAMRRTFVILSLRNNMDPGHIQAMLGQESLEMVYYYAQIADEDLIREHKAHSPIDNLD